MGSMAKIPVQIDKEVKPVDIDEDDFYSVLQDDEVDETLIDEDILDSEDFDIPIDYGFGMFDLNSTASYEDGEDEDFYIDLETEDGFDFQNLVENLPSWEVSKCLKVLEKARVVFMQMPHQGEKRSPAAEFYHGVNTPLFEKRIEYRSHIEQLEAVLSTLDDAEEISEVEMDIRRAKTRLDYITELLIAFNYGMAKAYVKRFTANTNADAHEEFTAAATIGLMYAVHTFDPSRGRFGTWSFKPIQRAVLKAVHYSDFSNMTAGDFEKRPWVLKALEDLKKEHGEDTDFSDQIVAEKAGVSTDLVRRVLRAPRVESSNMILAGSEDTEKGEFLVDTSPSVEDTVLTNLQVETLLKAGLSMLSPRERYVTICRYGLHGEPPEALSDIGENLELSREAVRQIAGKALSRLMHPLVLATLVKGS